MEALGQLRFLQLPAPLLAALLVAVYALYPGIAFETTDDLTVAMLLKGGIIFPTPVTDFFPLNIGHGPVGQLISALYQWQPGIGWYSWYSLLLLWLALLLLLRAVQQLWPLWGSAMVIALGVVLVPYLSFTRLAILLGMGAGMVLASRPGTGTRQRQLWLLAGLAAMVLAVWSRTEAALAGLLLSAPMWLVCAAAWRILAVRAGLVVSVAAAASLPYLLHPDPMQLKPLYAAWFDIMDRCMYADNPDAPAETRRVYQALSTWQVHDASVANWQRLKTALPLLQQVEAARRKRFELSPFSLSSLVLAAAVWLVLLALAAVRRQWRGLVAAVVWSAVPAGMVLALWWWFKLPDRLLHPLLAALVIGTAVLCIPRSLKPGHVPVALRICLLVLLIAQVVPARQLAARRKLWYADLYPAMHQLNCLRTLGPVLSDWCAYHVSTAPWGLDAQLPNARQQPGIHGITELCSWSRILHPVRRQWQQNEQAAGGPQLLYLDLWNTPGMYYWHLGNEADGIFEHFRYWHRLHIGRIPVHTDCMTSTTLWHTRAALLPGGAEQASPQPVPHK